MKKTFISAALATTMLLTACGGEGRMSVQDSCKYLSSDAFKPAGTQLQQAKQLADHYADVAKKVDPSIGVLIQNMADLQKKVADSSTGIVGPDQQKQLADAYNNVGKICGG
jgi:DNA-directed RNA polymerase